MISTRSKLSLCQYLELQRPDFLCILLEKHGLSTDGLDAMYAPDVMGALRTSVFAAHSEQVHSLLTEVVRTQGDLRTRVSPRYVYDQRWEDLVHCLQLDGYKLGSRNLTPVDPTIEGAEPLEDDLSAELKRSRLAEAEEILRTLNNSADAFRKVPPDYNACLGNARVALQTLATAIAKVRRATQPDSFDETKWGQVLAYLRTSGWITKPEEEIIAGVFGFVSQGAHIPVGLTEQEMARLGRHLVAAMCYFLVKRHNQ